MGSEYVSQAAIRTPPGAGTKLSCTTTSSSAQDLSAHQGYWVTFKCTNTSASTVSIHVIFGVAGVDAAQVSDFPIANNETVDFYIPMDGSRSYLRARTSAGTADLIWARTG